MFGYAIEMQRDGKRTIVQTCNDISAGMHWLIAKQKEFNNTLWMDPMEPDPNVRVTLRVINQADGVMFFRLIRLKA